MTDWRNEYTQNHRYLNDSITKTLDVGTAYYMQFSDEVRRLDKKIDGYKHGIDEQFAATQASYEPPRIQPATPHQVELFVQCTTVREFVVMKLVFWLGDMIDALNDWLEAKLD
jgi:hypothetical protein